MTGTDPVSMLFKCNACGREVEVLQYGAPEAGCVEPSSPPKGWRTIWTVIETATNDRGGGSSSIGEVSHSCPDCNVHMTEDEHHEAEHEARRLKMGGKAK